MNALFGLIYHACAFLVATIGIITLAQNRKDRSRWSFFLFTFGILGWMLSLYWGYYFADANGGPWALMLIRSAYGFSVLGMTAMTFFLFDFPRKSIEISIYLVSVFIAFTATLIVVSSMTSLVHDSLVFDGLTYKEDKLGPLYGFYVLDLLINLGLGFWITIRKWIRAKGIEKEKMLFVTVGYFVFVTSAILTNVVLPMFHVFILQREVPILTLFFVAPAFYAIRKYRFFNLSYVALNFLRQCILIAFFLAMTVLTYWLMGGGAISIVSEVDLLVSALVGLVAYLVLKRLIPELTSESFREFRRSLAELGNHVYLCDSFADLEKLVHKTFLLHAGSEEAKLYLVRPDRSIDHDISIYIEDELTRFLGANLDEVLIKGEIPYIKAGSGIKESLTRLMESIGADFCLPLEFDGKLNAFLMLRGVEGVSYSKEQIHELIRLKDHLEIALMNILLRMNLVEENNVMRKIINEKTKQLRERFKRIKTLSEQQSDFIAVTAHELRTPLSIASFQVKELLRRTSVIDYQDMKKELAVVDGTLDNLTNLTKKLFDVQQFDFEKVKLHVVKTDLKKYIKSVYDECLSVMGDKAVNLVLQDKIARPLKISIDPAQMRQVLHNLIGNAYKFVPAGGLISFECEEVKGGVHIRVGDTGRGIPDALKPSVFDKFKSKGPKSGVGLGLYICRKIVDLHGGNISVGDSELGGALFTVFLKK